MQILLEHTSILELVVKWTLFVEPLYLKEERLFFAMPSTTIKGISKITPYLKEGASVTTTRAHVHYVATEYGVVNLFGKSLKQRAKALISIAHPNFREMLEREAFKRFH